ncbi:alkaline phosphatase family protein [Planctomicrobium sp.]|jgi:predicted AlkP superfamily pyrophosphatase or phosphodiesterase|nr:nucleotide pyrophosphatase/phosphodiesterase family protein [Planctomicrobium sp.]MDA7503619.1 alkaline phosphatase family protein [bacterium]MBT5020686.1 alkaline phosphatase family protein [Planctomicrobium sp.]MDB4731597.1 alkaline phosphatase family protein [bacterium]MDB4733629.1 alkaline phosphatase family protein [Planctomicrobium sp.]MDB4743440.1 alkaline phosphatase family protein [Planctomicrobium sp.]
MPSTVLVSVPGLRSEDLQHMPNLQKIANRGSVKPLTASFPCVTCPVQANLTTGVGPDVHGVIANGFFYRDKGEVELWTAWNECIEAPQVWDLLHDADEKITSAVWFPMHSKGAGADYICTPAPIHNPDGSESLWCYTKPEQLYGELRDDLGHFPLMNFWGPIANIKSSDWIIDSAIKAAHEFKPDFFYIYVTHLDYAAQKFGPDSPEALQAVKDIDVSLGRLIDGIESSEMESIHWLFASEYTISEVNDVCYPNRILRDAGYLSLQEDAGLENLVPGESRAWAMVDHQLTHVFVKNAEDIETVANLFREHPLVEEVLVDEQRGKYKLDHPRSGEVVLVSKPEAWFAYYWWNDDAKAPKFARTVDIHRKPGYDPVEMFINMPSKTTPLDATLVKGSHGYPGSTGVLVSSKTLEKDQYTDLDVTPLVLQDFGVEFSSVD